MKKKLNLLFWVVITANMLFACGGGGSTAPAGPTIVNLSTFQNASVVIGQSNFNGGTANQGGAAGANTFSTPYGKPVVYNGILYAPDYSNNRVLGFNTVPTSNNASADFVLGQPDFFTTTPGSAANQMRGPESIRVSGGKLLVDEYSNNRILIWNSAPTTSTQPADVVVGQTGFGLTGSSCTQAGLKNSESIETAGGKLIVADSNNNRVLIWNTIPTSNGVPADVVLGQNSFTTCIANDDDQNGVQDVAPTARTLSYPSDVWSDGTRLIVADANNNRVLIWNSIPTSNFTPVDVVLGQGDFTHKAINDDNQDGVADANPTARTLSFPYYLDSNGTQLVVSDIGNSRVLIWNTIPTSNFTAANVVLGQGDFTHYTANDDNQDGVADANPTARTLRSPTGVYILGTKLFIGDHSNSRYLIFE
jgi:adenosine/AMP kinase